VCRELFEQSLSLDEHEGIGSQCDKKWQAAKKKQFRVLQEKCETLKWQSKSINEGSDPGSFSKMRSHGALVYHVGSN